MALFDNKKGHLHCTIINHQPYHPKDHETKQNQVCRFCIYAIMAQRHMTQSQVADEMLIGTGTLSEYLTGKHSHYGVQYLIVKWFKRQIELLESEKTILTPAPVYKEKVVVKVQLKENKPIVKETKKEQPETAICHAELMDRIRSQLKDSDNFKEIRGGGPGYVYVMGDGISAPNKIGMTVSTMEQRIKQLATGAKDLRTLCHIVCQNALYVETIAHRVLRKAKLQLDLPNKLDGDAKPTEFFNISRHDAIRLIEFIRATVEKDEHVMPF